MSDGQFSPESSSDSADIPAIPQQPDPQVEQDLTPASDDAGILLPGGGQYPDDVFGDFGDQPAGEIQIEPIEAPVNEFSIPASTEDDMFSVDELIDEPADAATPTEIELPAPQPLAVNDGADMFSVDDLIEDEPEGVQQPEAAAPEPLALPEPLAAVEPPAMPEPVVSAEPVLPDLAESTPVSEVQPTAVSNPYAPVPPAVEVTETAPESVNPYASSAQPSEPVAEEVSNPYAVAPQPEAPAAQEIANPYAAAPQPEAPQPEAQPAPEVANPYAEAPAAQEIANPYAAAPQAEVSPTPEVANPYAEVPAAEPAAPEVANPYAVAPEADVAAAPEVANPYAQAPEADVPAPIEAEPQYTQADVQLSPGSGPLVPEQPSRGADELPVPDGEADDVYGAAATPVAHTAPVARRNGSVPPPGMEEVVAGEIVVADSKGTFGGLVSGKKKRKSLSFGRKQKAVQFTYSAPKQVQPSEDAAAAQQAFETVVDPAVGAPEQIMPQEQSADAPVELPAAEFAPEMPQPQAEPAKPKSFFGIKYGKAAPAPAEPVSGLQAAPEPELPEHLVAGQTEVYQPASPIIEEQVPQAQVPEPMAEVIQSAEAAAHTKRGRKNKAPKVKKQKTPKQGKSIADKVLGEVEPGQRHSVLGFKFGSPAKAPEEQMPAASAEGVMEFPGHQSAAATAMAQPYGAQPENPQSHFPGGYPADFASGAAEGQPLATAAASAQIPEQIMPPPEQLAQAG